MHGGWAGMYDNASGVAAEGKSYVISRIEATGVQNAGQALIHLLSSSRSIPGIPRFSLAVLGLGLCSGSDSSMATDGDPFAVRRYNTLAYLHPRGSPAVVPKSQHIQGLRASPSVRPHNKGAA